MEHRREMIRLIELLSTGTAIVLTSELYRVILEPRGSIIGELLEIHEAEALRDTVKACSDGTQHAVIQAYADAFKLSGLKVSSN
jgi:hypothetical protein